VDFGMAKEMAQKFKSEDCARLYSMCGTPEYMAPEVLKEEGYTFSLDWYCFGAVVYEMLVGAPPYYSNDRSDMFDRILHSRLKFPSHLNENSVDLISRLLDRNQSTRLGAGSLGSQEIKDHPFFDTIDWDKVLAKKIKPPFTPNVTGLFDMSNIDPMFYTQPIPQSIENEGRVTAIPGYATEQLQRDILDLFGGIKPNIDPNFNDVSNDLDYNTQFFASESRFSLSQSRFHHHEDLSSSPIPIPASSSRTCPQSNDSFIHRSNFEQGSESTCPFQGFSYVCSQIDDQ